MRTRSGSSSIRVSRPVYGTPAGRNAEAAALDVDEALDVRVLARAGHVDVGLQRAGDIGDCGVKPWTMPRFDRAGTDVQIDLVAGRGRHVAAVRSLAKKLVGTEPLTVTDSVARLLQRRVEADARAL